MSCGREAQMVPEREEDLPVRTWLNNIKDWTDHNFQQLISTAEDRQLVEIQCFESHQLVTRLLPSYGS